MEAFTIDARFIRAAQHACATPNDVRYYLHGIHLRPGGLIEATNGHVLYQGRYTAELGVSESMILNIDGKIPTSATTVTFLFEGNSFEGTARTDKGKLFAVKRIDGKFPDVDRVIPGERAQFSNGMPFDPAYLVKIGQIAGTKVGKASLVMTHGTEYESALFTFGLGTTDNKPVRSEDLYINSFKAVLMPIRVGDNFLLSPEPKALAA